MAQSKKVLIVEDEAPMAKALKLKLEKEEGIEAEIAGNGAKGLEKLKEGSYDLILLDIVMPEKNGFDVLEKLKEDGNKTPVIMLTNLGEDDDVQKAKKLGAVDYYVKSDTELADIVKKVKNHLS